MLIGAQLYTVRDFTQNEKDFDETIKKVKEIGYSCVQVSGIGDIKAEKIKEICDKYEIKNIITHTRPDRVLNDIDNVIAEHKIMEAGYIGIGGLPNEYRANADALKKFTADYGPIAKKIADAGMKFMYHNHHWEFEKIDGKLIIDHLADSFPKELMGITLDTYWVQAGGGDSAYYLKKFAGRVDCIHFKDMIIFRGAEGNVIQAMSPILEGNLNWPAIFDACKEAGVKYAFVEQDDSYVHDPFGCLEISYNNLKKQGFK